MKIDTNFNPLSKRLRAFENAAKAGGNVLTFCLLSGDGYTYRHSLCVFPDGAGFDEENFYFAERTLKTLLWLVGGHTVYVHCSPLLFKRLAAAYSANGARAFDYNFMSRVYERPLTLVNCEPSSFPPEKPCRIAAQGNLTGCRIGFDAGGSDRKVCAVRDGEVLFSEEVVWNPKTATDPAYHREGIMAAFRKAASYLPRVDAIGVSSAGIYVANRIMVASLFLAVSDEDFEREIKNLYVECAAELGENIPLVVANDGDVTALAGAMSLDRGRLLGIAMGTSEAAGYIDDNRCLHGLLSELAFVPVDTNPAAARDEWSGDVGCGVKYLSQDGVIKLAEMAGYVFDPAATPAEKLKTVQELCAQGSSLAVDVFTDVGEYLAHAIAQYSRFYDIGTVLTLGRVSAGKGGEILLSRAREVLAADYPDLDIDLVLPDEKSRRVGQAIAAATL